MEGDAAAVRSRLEQWFNESMDRVSGWYKRRTQALIVVIAACVAVGFNVDTIRITRHLFRDPVTRAALSKEANYVIDQGRGVAVDSLQREVGRLVESSEFSRLPLGWDNVCTPNMDACEFSWGSVLGLFLTVLALAQGAPFWFETLNKIANLRQTGKPPDVPASVKS